MKNLLGALALVTAMAGGAAADVSIVKANITQTVDCTKDSSVSIAASNAKLTLTGTCDNVSITGNNAKITGAVKNLSIAGNNNKLDLTAVDNINVAGNNNAITYKGATTATATPVVSNIGTNNTIAGPKAKP